ncbi:minor capsid protein [Cytobacillus horneckiae]|uniref:putative minor capsid protein n=1 Tax=Cytobacillus horneckiae TaxID=549687 RepID=UPI0019CF4E3B|nr:putative minor capsid protein [Cytobacillus horneckiae]MBN6889903.1 minor capsid protein [Cytobacillus horneckiae]
MAKIKPIPKSLLIHTIEYEKFLKDGRYGPEFDEKETIVSVRVEPLTKLVRDSNNEEVQASAIIFIDSVNTPNAKPLIEKSKVHFRGRDYVVLSCEPLYALDPETPHHWEVSLT